jgi:hypothetical protein
MVKQGRYRFLALPCLLNLFFYGAYAIPALLHFALWGGYVKEAVLDNLTALLQNRETKGIFMQHQPISTRTVLLLTAAALILPVAISIVIGTAALLGAMDDAVGAAVLRYVALACGLAWVIDLACLVVVLAIHWLAQKDETDG